MGGTRSQRQSPLRRKIDIAPASTIDFRKSLEFERRSNPRADTNSFLKHSSIRQVDFYLVVAPLPSPRISTALKTADFELALTYIKELTDRSKRVLLGPQHVSNKPAARIGTRSSSCLMLLSSGPATSGDSVVVLAARTEATRDPKSRMPKPFDSPGSRVATASKSKVA